MTTLFTLTTTCLDVDWDILIMTVAMPMMMGIFRVP